MRAFPAASVYARVVDALRVLERHGRAVGLFRNARRKLIEVRGRVVEHAVPEWVIGVQGDLRQHGCVAQERDAALMFFARERIGRVIVRILAVEIGRRGFETELEVDQVGQLLVASVRQPLNVASPLNVAVPT